jgi:hypothetical protein
MSPGRSVFFGASLSSSNSEFNPLKERKHRTNLKAELVRKELLSRSDLIKLYQPPIPKDQLPSSNPFYTKTIVTAANQVNASPYYGS